MLHFIYTVPRSESLARRVVDKAIGASNGIIPPLHRSGVDAFIPWKHPIRAPHSISYHLLGALKKRAPTRFYSMYEHGVCKVAKNDLVLAQPLPLGGFGSTRPKTDDPRSVTSRTIREHRATRNIIIMPYAHDELLVSWAHDLLSHTSEVVFIGGKIWSEQWEERSPFADLTFERRIHVDMGIDPIDYPRVKSRFNPKGKRKYLYIGHTSWYKNTNELERIAELIPHFEGGHIGGGSIRGWKKIANFADLTPEYMSKLAEEYDFFVNTSTADAQATTILEQMCFGLIVACTPESGYDHPSLIRLHTSDTRHNVRILSALQDKDEDELLAITEENRRIAVTQHSWERFTTQILDFIGL